MCFVEKKKERKTDWANKIELKNLIKKFKKKKEKKSSKQNSFHRAQFRSHRVLVSETWGKVNDIRRGRQGLPLDSVRARRNPFPGQETRMASDGPTEWANCKFVFDMCELQVHHLQLLACERTRRSEKERARRTRKARTRHRRMRLPLFQINVHLCFRPGKKKERRERKRERKRERERENVWPVRWPLSTWQGKRNRRLATNEVNEPQRRRRRRRRGRLGRLLSLSGSGCRSSLPFRCPLDAIPRLQVYMYDNILSRDCYYREFRTNHWLDIGFRLFSIFFIPKIEPAFALDILCCTSLRVGKIYWSKIDIFEYIFLIVTKRRFVEWFLLILLAWKEENGIVDCWNRWIM